MRVALPCYDKKKSVLHSGLLRSKSDVAAQEDDRTEPSLILLKNLVTYQNGLLGGRELEVFDLLLELRQRTSKSVRLTSDLGIVEKHIKLTKFSHNACRLLRPLR